MNQGLNTEVSDSGLGEIFISQPDVSVIIPTYNRQNKLIGAISSILQQSIGVHNLEIIVVDDCSTDRSERILRIFVEEFPDRFFYLRNEKNMGPGASRNKGLSRARGKYVFFLDSDDTLNQLSLQRAVRCADENHTDIVFLKAEKPDGSVWAPTVFSSHLQKVDFYKTKAYWSLSPWKLFRKSLILENSIFFDEVVKVGEDHPFTTQALFRSGSISILSDISYIRLGSGDDQLTRLNKNNLNIDQKIYVATRMLEIISELGRSNQSSAQFKVRHFRDQIIPCMRHILNNGGSGAQIQKILEISLPHLREDDLLSLIKNRNGHGEIIDAFVRRHHIL